MTVRFRKYGEYFLGTGTNQTSGWPVSIPILITSPLFPDTLFHLSIKTPLMFFSGCFDGTFPLRISVAGGDRKHYLRAFG